MRHAKPQGHTKADQLGKVPEITRDETCSGAKLRRAQIAMEEFLPYARKYREMLLLAGQTDGGSNQHYSQLVRRLELGRYWP